MNKRLLVVAAIGAFLAGFLAHCTVANAMDADDANAKCRAAIKSRLLFPDLATFGARDAGEIKPGVWSVFRVVTIGGRNITFLCVIRDGAVVKVTN